MPDLDFTNRRIAITGGASGIGYATAERLVRAGAHVALLDLSEERVNASAESLRRFGTEVAAVPLDVSDEHAVEAAAERLSASHGPYCGLVTSAGISIAAKAEALTAAQWTRVMNVNALGTFLCCRAFGARMIDVGRGSIVALGSIDGLGAHAGRAAYVSSKFAVHGLVRSLALEWARHGVRVNAVAPTFVDTPLLRNSIPEAFMETILDRTPMGRIASAEDIAGNILYLLSDLSGYVTGAILPVDGGITLGHVTRRGGADLSSRTLLTAGVYDEEG